MITKDKLLLIRNDFSVHHVYAADEYAAGKHPHYRSIEVAPYDGAVFCLVSVCAEHLDGPDHPVALNWLIRVVFSNGKRTNFRTGKEVHIHVMVALDTLINVAVAA